MPPILITRSGTACLSPDQAASVVLFDAMERPRQHSAIRSHIKAQRVTLPDPWAIAAASRNPSGAPGAPGRA